ncbi:MAG: alpha/beta hydrolase-fold protein [Burkholderiaceae bacterium]
MNPSFERLELLSEHACFGGVQRFYKHMSSEIGLPMRFGLFLPAKAVAGEKVPLLTFLAGLTCTEETFAFKAGAQRVAAELGFALLTPRHQPAQHRGWTAKTTTGILVGAGFYLDATQAPWSGHWCMESYLVKELLPEVIEAFALDGERLGCSVIPWAGTALTLALRHPGRFRSLSAFAPICAPTQCPWGHKAFTGYLGQDERPGARTMPACSWRVRPRPPPGIPGGSGLADKFLAEQLHPRGAGGGLRQGGAAIGRCAATRATTTATTSSAPLWKTICATTRKR